MNVLVIDIGGTNLKISVTGNDEIRKTPSGTDLTPEKMVAETKKLAKGWSYDAVSIGYPGAVVDNRATKDPANLAPGWVDFNFETAFRRPVKVINDAAMQALGSSEGGRMLFLGLGTGLGSAMVIQKIVMPMELAHLPYKKGKTYEEWVGKQAYEKLGRKKWEKVVGEVVGVLKFALQADYVVLGGGNAKKIKSVPEGARLGANTNAFIGGFRLWDDHRGRRRK